VLFRPPALGAFDAQVLVRNNASWLHPLLLRGAGGQGTLALRTPDGRAHGAGSVVALRFTVNASHWAAAAGQRRAAGTHGAGSAWGAGKSPSSASSAAASSLPSPADSDEVLRAAGSVWPRPAQHSFRVENHGDMPLEVTELAVGSGQGRQSCGAAAAAAAAWPAFGFSVDGCRALPLALPPGHAWEVHVGYRTDCTSTNELASLRVGTSAGSVDLILQALVDPRDMPRCEASRLAAQSSSTFRAAR
jgi:hypothetical protein